MKHSITEKDWKHFKLLHKAALDRFCHQTLSEVKNLIDKPGMDLHERYGAVYGLIKSRDKELAGMFDGMSRSNAHSQLMAMRRRKLVTDEEFAEFSPETRERVTSWLAQI